jgi:hypothetical protein
MARRFLRDLVRRIRSLANDTFHVHRDDLLEQKSAVAFDVIQVKDSRAIPPKQFLQRCFSLDERQHSQIFAVEIKKVERNEDSLTPPKEQITEHRSASIIDASNLNHQGRRFQREDVLRSMWRDPQSDEVDLIRQIKPPFSATSVIREFSELLHEWGCDCVRGDRWSGPLVEAEFTKNNIASSKSMSRRVTCIFLS